jgi:predicted nucleic acid binding AN1-type Zn finger protein
VGNDKHNEKKQAKMPLSVMIYLGLLVLYDSYFTKGALANRSQKVEVV